MFGHHEEVMGRDAVPRGRQPLPSLNQKSVEVLPTRTVYAFSGYGIDLGQLHTLLESVLVSVCGGELGLSLS